MRTETAQILDELAGLANDAWEAYQQAAHWAGPGELADLFATLGSQRRAMALAIEGFVAELGHRPRDRDTNSGVAFRMAARLKASFAGDRPRALVDECERSETAFAHCIITIDEGGLPPHMVQSLRGFHAEVVAALGQLAAAKVRHRGH